MSVVKKVGTEYYVFKRTIGKGRAHKLRTKKEKEWGKRNWRNWWLVKYHCAKCNRGTLSLQKDLYLPSEFVGKKVRLKVEIIEDKQT